VWLIAYPNGIAEPEPGTEAESGRIGRAARMELEWKNPGYGDGIATNSNGIRCNSGRNPQRFNKNHLDEEWNPSKAFKPGSQRECGAKSICSTPSNANHSGLETRERSTCAALPIGTTERSRCLSVAGGGQQEDKVKSSFRRENDGLPRGMDRPYLMALEDLPHLLPIATDSENTPNRTDRLKALGNAVVPHAAAIPLRKIILGDFG